MTSPSVAQPAATSIDTAALAPVPGEQAIEGRLLAPCCWNQTLDVHESEVTRALRLEIRGRLLAGESAEAIEQSLVARYGERLRASPVNDPLRSVALVMLVVAALSGFAALALVRRWQRRAGRKESLGQALAANGRDADDDRIDAELAALD